MALKESTRKDLDTIKGTRAADALVSFLQGEMEAARDKAAFNTFDKDGEREAASAVARYLRNTVREVEDELDRPGIPDRPERGGVVTW